jgi:predicted DCC family thiol-disulfide oxidoreductase YuxK
MSENHNQKSEPVTKLDKVILFDGTCILCNHTFKWILKADKKQKFKFGLLQDEHVKARVNYALGQKAKKYPKNIDSVILLDGEQIYFLSSAVLRICAQLGGLYQLLLIFWLMPKFIRDAVYSFIATNRYKWFGTQTCYFPDQTIKNRFI